MTQQWRNWAGTERVRPARVATPRSTDEVVEVVRAAVRDGLAVKAVGAGHSFTGAALAPGVQVRPEGLSGLHQVVPATGLVTVGAGTRLHELTPLLARHGLAMETMGDIDRQTIAGAVSTGTHGSSRRFGSISTQVRAVELVTADGTVLRVSATEHADLLDAVRLSVGALGVLTTVTLQCVPLYALRARDVKAPLEEVLERLDELVAAHDHFEFFWFPHTRTALTRRFDRLPGDVPLAPLGRLSRAVDERVTTNLGWEAALRAASRAPRLVPRVNRLVAGAVGERDVTDLAPRVFASARDVRFHEGEYAVPRDALVEVLRELLDVAERQDHPVAFPFEVRFLAADDLWLSPAHGRDSAFVAFHQYHRMPHQRFFDACEDVLLAAGGRPHWGKLHRLGAAGLRERLPRFDDFTALRDRLDPTGVLANPYLDRVLGVPPEAARGPRPGAGRLPEPSRREPPAAQRARLDRATAGLDAPVAVVDLAAYDANAADLVQRAGGTPVRLASKSVRCRALVERALAVPGFHGVLAYALGEALWLVREGVCDDVVVGYPTAERAALRELGADPALAAAVTLMVDDVAQLDLVDAVVPPGRREELRVCLDLDASLRALGGRVHLGARRSPVHDVAAARALARTVADRRGFRLVGLMAYEGQVAGQGDRPLGRAWQAPAIGAVKAASVRQVAARRAAVVAAVREVADLAFVNGGGTGSLETTAAEACVTEVAAGSGLLAPALFDRYDAFRPRPAALFGLDVTRRPGPGVVTVAGGGWVASGPPGADRLPLPTHPAGLALTGLEAAGEVQTPLVGAAADRLAVGDRVWFRHAKAGELCERVDTLHLVEGDRVVDAVPTYRGEGRTWL